MRYLLLLSTLVITGLLLLHLDAYAQNQNAQNDLSSWWEPAMDRMLTNGFARSDTARTQDRGRSGSDGVRTERSRTRGNGSGRTGSQGRTRETGDRTERDHQQTGNRTEPGERAERGERGRGGRGQIGSRGQGQHGSPAFCRSGEGHPVHGRQWCIEKGFGLGGSVYERHDRQPRWGREDLGDIVIGNGEHRLQQQNNRGGMLEDVLGDILGRDVLRRVEDQARHLQADGLLRGRWTDTSDGSRVLQVRVGETPVAEFAVSAADGSVDAVLFNRGQ